MKLYLQMGHGMAGLTNYLIENWGGGLAILSPRNQTDDALVNSSKKIRSLGGQVVFDPQFYLPRSDHHRLTKHSYWPSSYSTTDSIDDEVKKMVDKLISDYNTPLETEFFILPGYIAKKISEQWCSYHKSIVDYASSKANGKPVFATIPLSYEVIQSEDQIHELLECIESWDVDGFYIVPEKPREEYLTQDPIWLLNLMDLCSALVHQKKRVIVGYANHQLFPLVLTGVEGIASGNWMNVRNFTSGCFSNPEDTDRRNSVWYYCPQALSEYQLSFLDIAKRGGVLDILKTDKSFNSPEADILFSGAQPSTTAFQLRGAFRHYLQALKIQTEGLRRSTYQETKDNLNVIYSTASELLSTVRSKGVRGKNRDFSDVMDINLSAVDSFDSLRGFVMRQIW